MKKNRTAALLPRRRREKKGLRFKFQASVLKVIVFFPPPSPKQPQFLTRHFRRDVDFRASRATVGLFTTRLAKMADAQVREALRRGALNSTIRRVYKHAAYMWRIYAFVMCLGVVLGGFNTPKGFFFKGWGWGGVT